MKSKFSHILIYQIQYVGTRVGGGRQRNGIGTERTTERLPQLQYRVPARTVRVVWLSARSGYSNLVPVPVYFEVPNSTTVRLNLATRTGRDKRLHGRTYAPSTRVEYRSYGTHVWPYHGRLNCKTVLGHKYSCNTRLHEGADAAWFI